MITYEDFYEAIREIFDAEDDFKALGYDESEYRLMVQDVVEVTQEANRSANRVMGYGATLAWGMAIDQLAERLRAAREDA